MLEVANGWSLDVARGPDWLFVHLNPADEQWTDTTGLADALWGLLEQQFARRLVLELQDLPTLSSSLLGELVRLHNRIDRRGGLMRLCGLSQRNLDALRLTRLQRCLPHYGSREDALHGGYPKPR